MKLLTGLATTTALLVLGCGGSKKSAEKPAPTPDKTAADGTAAGDAAGSGDMKAEPALPPDTGGYKLMAPDALQWMPLNPDGPGPELAVVHGDLENGGAMFLRVQPGHNAGVHTHTNDYHAVVVSGAPKHYLAGGAKKAKPLAVGDYWFQPGGQAHNDECTGTEPCVLFIVIGGKFDMQATPKAKAPKMGAYAMVTGAQQKFAPLDPTHPEGAKAAFVHGDPATGPVAFVIELPPGGNSGLHSHTSEYHAVVLQGAPAHWLPHEKAEGTAVEPGTYWYQPGGYDHGDRCTSDGPCRAFVYVNGGFDYKPAASK